VPKTSKIVRKLSTQTRFRDIFLCFLGSGARLGAVAFRVQEKCHKWFVFGLDFGSFSDRFGTLRCLFEGVFVGVFSGAPLLRTLDDFVAQG